MKETIRFEKASLKMVDVHVVMAYTIPLLTDLLQLKYQNEPISPFQTHPAAMAIFLASLLLYALALALLHRRPRLFPCTRIARALAAAASVGSLVTVFLPPEWVNAATVAAFLLLLALLGCKLAWDWWIKPSVTGWHPGALNWARGVLLVLVLLDVN